MSIPPLSDPVPGFTDAEPVAMSARGPAPLPTAELAGRLAAADGPVALDLGTGDGRWVLRHARAHPDALVIGIDPSADSLAESARRAAAKPTRGGAPNALFLLAAIETLPEPLAGRVDDLLVQFPWGSLLRAVSWPTPEGAAVLAALLRPGGSLTLLLNTSATEDSAYAGRLQVPTLDEAHVADHLLPGLAAAGFQVTEARPLAPGEDPPHRTSWGRRLIAGSGRRTLLVGGTRAAAEPRR